MATEPALVLPVGVMPSSETQVFPGVPGMWTPGEAKALRAVGLDEDTAQQLIDDNDLPLEWTEVDELPDGFLDSTAGLVSSATITSAPVGEEAVPAEGTEATAVYLDEYPRTHAELDQVAADHAFTWPAAVKTVIDKQHALADAGIAPAEAEEDAEGEGSGEGNDD